MDFKNMIYCIDSPWAWTIILLLSLRAVYTCSKDKDYPHLAAFAVVAIASLYMLGAGLGYFPVPAVFQ